MWLKIDQIYIYFDENHLDNLNFLQLSGIQHKKELMGS